MTEKYPGLTNTDLAELLGLNRLIQFEKLPQRFKDMNTYVPYGHDLIELIQERLRDSDPALLLVAKEQGETNQENHFTMDLSYYFSRNADLRYTIQNAFMRYGIATGRPAEALINEILGSIHKHGLVAKTVPNGPAFSLSVGLGISSNPLIGKIIDQSTCADWEIIEKNDESVPQVAEKTEVIERDGKSYVRNLDKPMYWLEHVLIPDAKNEVEANHIPVPKENWGDVVQVENHPDLLFNIGMMISLGNAEPAGVYINGYKRYVDIYYRTSCGETEYRVESFDQNTNHVGRNFFHKLPGE